MANARPLSEKVRAQQLLYMGKVAQRPENDPVRQCMFQNGSFHLMMPSGKRGRGRPSHQWAQVVHGKCVQVAGSQSMLDEYFNGTPSKWRQAVDQHFAVS